MNRYNDGAYAQTAAKRHQSEEGKTRSMHRLRNANSNAAIRSASHTHRNTYHQGERDDHETFGGAQQGMKGPRKGSLRNAFRRMLRKRSKEAEAEPRLSTTSQHGYHKSEPVGMLTTHAEETEKPALELRRSQRNFSVPLELPRTSGTFPRARSPYAVEFPHSARLKPLNLGNPFHAPGSQLRRRKTLPSMLVEGEDAAAIKESIENSTERPTHDASSDLPPSQIGRALSTGEGDKRRSRSEADLGALRVSGFRVSDLRAATGDEREEEEEKTPIPEITDSFDTGAGAAEASSSGLGGLKTHPVDGESFSAVGTELSRDLEDRVARLEHGLRSFQASLEKLHSDRNRRTVVVGNPPETHDVPANATKRRRSSHDRTTSLLLSDLDRDLEPSRYHYDYRDTLKPRPSTSPRPLASPSVLSSDPTLIAAEPAMDDPFTTSTAPSSNPRSNAGPASHTQQTPQHTFRSLYEMLADERSARRKLEQTMRSLQTEIANLNYQVSLTSHSNVQSQRSSYLPSSTRLQALLADTEESPPATRDSQQQRFGGERLSIDPRAVSRFSASESEAPLGDAEGEAVDTPCEEFQTPAEEQSPGRFIFGGEEGRQAHAGGNRTDGGMF